MSFQVIEAYAVVGASGFIAAWHYLFGIVFWIRQTKQYSYGLLFAKFHASVGRVVRTKLYLTISKSKLLEATSIEEELKATEYDWETEKCILVYWFSDNALFAHECF